MEEEIIYIKEQMEDNKPAVEKKNELGMKLNSNSQGREIKFELTGLKSVLLVKEVSKVRVLISCFNSA